MLLHRLVKKLNKIALDTNSFLRVYLRRQSEAELIKPMTYSLLPGGKKIRSKILTDVGKIFGISYKTLIKIGAIDITPLFSGPRPFSRCKRPRPKVGRCATSCSLGSVFAQKRGLMARRWLSPRPRR